MEIIFEKELPGITKEQLFEWYSKQQKEFLPPEIIGLQKFVSEYTLNKTEMIKYRAKMLESIDNHMKKILAAILFNGPEHLLYPYSFAGFKGMGVPFSLQSEIIVYKSKGDPEKPSMDLYEFETEKQIHWRITSFLTFRLKK